MRAALALAEKLVLPVAWCERAGQCATMSWENKLRKLAGISYLFLLSFQCCKKRDK